MNANMKREERENLDCIKICEAPSENQKAVNKNLTLILDIYDYPTHLSFDVHQFKISCFLQPPKLQPRNSTATLEIEMS